MGADQKKPLQVVTFIEEIYERTKLAYFYGYAFKPPVYVKI